MKAAEFDDQFEKNIHILQHLDLSAKKKGLQEQRRVNVDFPEWMIQSLDKEAKRLGVTRQSIIKMWLAERLEEKTLASQKLYTNN